MANKEAPVEAVCEPTGHAMHPVLPVETAYVLFVQGVHAVEPVEFA